MEKRKCNGENCSKDSSFLICPTCKKFGVKDLSKSYFCTQECFKNSYKSHKIMMHKLDDVCGIKEIIALSGFYSKEDLERVRTLEQLEKLQNDWTNNLCQQIEVLK